MKVVNRRATYDYQIVDKIEAGIVLTGGEVKSVKQRRIKLDSSFAKIVNDEALLINAFIAPYPFADNRKYQPTATRKLLLSKKQIISLKTRLRQQQLTLVPLSCYNKGRWIKILLGLGKGRKKYEKRELKKKRDQDRQIERIMRGKDPETQY